MTIIIIKHKYNIIILVQYLIFSKYVTVKTININNKTKKFLEAQCLIY